MIGGVTAAKAVLGRLPWRYILPAIGAGLALWAAYDWAWDRGHASRDGEVTAIRSERDAALWSVGQLSAALQQQTDAIAQAGRDTKDALDEGALAANDGRRTDAGEASLRARLEADAARTGPDGRCVTPPSVHDAWGRM